MTTAQKAAIGIAVLWSAVVGGAVLGQDLSASAGRIEGPVSGAGMVMGFAFVGAVVFAVLQIPERVPMLVRRLVLLVGMAGGFWGIGTLMRAAYALTL